MDNSCPSRWRDAVNDRDWVATLRAAPDAIAARELFLTRDAEITG